MKNKTKTQLTSELTKLRRRVAELEKSTSERKQLVEALREREERFRQFFENAPEYCYMISVDGVILDVNKAALKTLGYKKKELIGEPLKKIYAPESHKKMGRLFERWKKIGKLKNEEMVIITNKGNRRTVLLSSDAVTDKDGRILYSTSVQRDITELKQAEEALLNTDNRLELLQGVIAAMHRYLDLDKVFLQITDGFVYSLGYTTAVILMLNQKRGRYEVKSFTTKKGLISRINKIFGFSLKDFSVPAHEPINDFLDSVLSGKTMVAKNLIELLSPLVSKMVCRAVQRLGDSKNYIVVPLILDNVVVGAILITSPREEIPKEELETIGSLAEVAMNAIENATLHKQTEDAEKALHESEEKYSSVVNSSKDAIVIHENGIIKFVNPIAVELTGYTVDEFLDKNITDFISPEYQKLVTERFTARLAGKDVPAIYEIGIVKKDGTILPVEINVSLMNLKGKPVALIFVRDITERKKMELTLQESEQRFRNIIVSAPEAIIMLDSKGNISFWNDAAEEVFGYSSGEVLGKQMHEYLIPEDSRKAFLRGFDAFKISGTGPFINQKVELVTSKKGGVEFPIELSVSSVKLKGKWNAIAVVRDLTDQMEAEKKIRTSLREKEILLKEIHHRVKNNLQIISSLLNLQSTYIKDQKTLDMFKETQNRVRAMAFIHEKLYQSEDLTRIDFAEYTKNLATYLFHSFGISHNNITLRLNVHDIFFGIDTAIPCGLIINELVTNALKHGFPDKVGGEICIDFRSEGNKHTLAVSDNGVGLPANLDFQNTKSLGLQLVMTLVIQLNGTVNLDQSGGTKFEITFPSSAARKR